jgi:hypothetical protein
MSVIHAWLLILGLFIVLGIYSIGAKFFWDEVFVRWRVLKEEITFRYYRYRIKKQRREAIEQHEAVQNVGRRGSL